MKQSKRHVQVSTARTFLLWQRKYASSHKNPSNQQVKSTSQIDTIIEIVVREAASAMQGVVLAVQTNLQYIDANKQALDAIFTAYCVFTQIGNVTAASSMI